MVPDRINILQVLSATFRLYALGPIYGALPHWKTWILEPRNIITPSDQFNIFASSPTTLGAIG